MHPSKRTSFPVPLRLVQRILDQLGYGLVFENPDTQRLHFRRNHAPSAQVRGILGEIANPPETVIIARLDFTSDAYDHPVYDRDYVVDLLNKINGEVGGDSGSDLLVFLADQGPTH